MKEFQQRVVDEKAELDRRIEKLLNFIAAHGGAFETLPPADQSWLRVQLSVIMQSYSTILGDIADCHDSGEEEPQ